jgi:hypothetical protein
VLVLATKADKVPGSRRRKVLDDLGAQLGCELVPFSARTGDGREAVWGRIQGAAVKPRTRHADGAPGKGR